MKLKTPQAMSNNTEEILSVKDLVRFEEKDFNNTKILMAELDKLGKEYISLLDTPNPERLEAIKRTYGGYLTSLATYYSKIKAFKYQGDYLEEQRKRIKSETIQLIIDRDKVSTAAAEKVVYAEEYYKKRIDLMEELKKFFIKVELKYDRYRDTARDIYQSVSQNNQERRIQD
jgi:hypothetical protein